VNQRQRAQVAKPFRIVAIPAAIALGAIGAIAADRVGWPPIVGAAGGALAAVLTVLALPSVPTRRATVLLLGVGGLGALRHAAVPGRDSAPLLVLWAIGTLVTMLLVDRADAETAPALPGGTPLSNRVVETTRLTVLLAVTVIVVAVATVPSITEHLGRHVWPGRIPGLDDVANAPSSLKQTDTLDMTSRPRLSNDVVFTVDASRADYWRGQTFDTWDGHEWTRSDPGYTGYGVRRVGDNLLIPPAPDDPGAIDGVDFSQTFHIEAGYSEIVFAAPSPRLVQTDRVLHSAGDGNVTVEGGAGGGFGKGSVYTVVSRRMLATKSQLESSEYSPTPQSVLDLDAQLPPTTPRVTALARRITAGAHTRYDKIIAIEAWLGTHMHYSLNAPLSPKGVDVVDYFLFRSKEGWCEQISSSLVVLARSVGIPARLATGFATGSRDPLTGRFVVRESDAHAWAEVYFAGIGWQGFDPTQSVPLAGDSSSGGSWLQTARHNAPMFGIVAVLLVGAAICAPGLIAASHRRRRRRASWSAEALHRLERIGKRAGRARTPAETPREYATALAQRLGQPGLVAVGDTIDTEAFAPGGAREDARAAADAVLTSIRT
jgi:transglutaminase-like putative cysteine protease